MARIAIDSDSLQARQHLTGQSCGNSPSRLSSFVRAIESMGHSVAFDCLRRSTNHWKDADLIVIPTRHPEASVDPVLSDLAQFVARGSSLFLLSNHSRVPSSPKAGHYTLEDGKVAKLFGITLLDVCFRIDPHPNLTAICDVGSQVHPVLLNESGNRTIESIVINNGCAVDPLSTGSPVLLWPKNAVDYGPYAMKPDGLAFCWATETDGGKVLVTGDSGFLGEPGVAGSGPGLFDKGDNARFILQAITWLLDR